MLTLTKSDPIYAEYIKILNAELICATGCTEPIAIAYAAAKAREVLGALPDEFSVEASGNIIKNTKSVVVPNTSGMRGIEAAAAAGIVAGNAEAELEVLSNVCESERAAILAYRSTHSGEVIPSAGNKVFFIAVSVKSGTSSARVTIEDFHTNITHIE